MPGGLSEVSQSVGADASKYISEYRAALAVTKELSAANRDLMRAVAESQAAIRGAGGGGNAASGIGKVNAAIREHLELARQMQAAARDHVAMSADEERVVRAVAAAIDSASAASASHAAQIRATSGAAKDLTASLGDQVRVQQAANDAAKVLIENHVRLSDTARASGASVRAGAADLGALRDSARDTTSALADTAAAVGAVKAAAGTGGGDLASRMAASGFFGAGTGGGGGATSAATAAIIARNLARQGYGPTPGSTSPVDTALAALLGGGAGGGAGGGPPGGGGGGGAPPSFVPWAGGGWQAVRFWGMMTAEVASTVIPALAAAGSAALVGMQGMEQLSTRYKAIATVSEALGNAFGQTAGSFIGTGSALQNAQNAATGGVYELAGAGINLLKSGAGGGLLQMGTNTIAMLDRAAANIQPGLGGRIAGVLGGGTGYLRQFGDIGANLGNTLLNVAPNLPGVGADLLSALQGGTGALATATRDTPGPIMGGLLAAEAASRWLPALLGGQGLIGRMLGLRAGGWGLGKFLAPGGPGGIGGLLGKGGEALAARGLGGVMGDVGLGMIGAGDALAGLTGPETGGVGLGVYGLMQLARTMPSSAERQMAALQAGIGQAGFTGAWQPLGQAITTATGLGAAIPDARGKGIQFGPRGVTFPAMAQEVGAGEGAAGAMRFGPQGPTVAQIYQSAAQGFAQTQADLVRSGPQLVDALHKAGLKSVSMADAFQIAQNSLLDLTHAFDSHGKLTQTAKTMLGNYVAAIGPMTQSGGAFGAAVGAQTIMSSSAMQNLSKVNQSMDAMTQIMSAGPAGAAALTTMRGAIPQGFYKALGQGITTQAGAAAMTAFASTTQPSIISGLQQQADQMRTALTLGAVTQPQAAGMMGYQLQQFLPLARKDPAALAMLMQQGAQMGVGGYYQGDPSKPGVQEANYKAAVAATAKIADNSKQANTAYNSMTVKLADIPKVAQQFSQSVNADVMSQRAASAATAMIGVQNAALKGKGSVDTGALKQWETQMKAAGVSGAAAWQASINAAVSGTGISAGMQKKLQVQVAADTAPARAAISGIHGKNVKINATSDAAAAAAAAKAAMNTVHDKNVKINATSNAAAAAAAAKAAMNSVPNVTRVITIATNFVGGTGGGQYAQFGSQYAPGVSSPQILRSIGHAAGFLVPGFGGGDRHLALLEGGEAVVPKELTASVAPYLSAHGVPGFAAGGIAGQMGPVFFSGMMIQALSGDAVKSSLRQTIDGLIGAGLASAAQGITPGISAAVQALAGTRAAGGTGGGLAVLPLPIAASKVLDQLLGELSKQGAWKQFAVNVINGITYSLDANGANANKAGAALVKQTAAAASSMVSHIQQEVAYAQSTTSAMTGGLNFGSMDVSPTGPGPVQIQMQSYAASLQAFSADIRSMSRGGLNKDLLQQMIAAGPVQGDALAQSISSGPGGIRAVNQLYAGIQHLAGKLGAQAAGAVFGGTLAPNLKSGTFVNNNITISIGGGGGAASLAGLSNAQIKELTNVIQAKLLQQAKRNRRTGTTLPGYGA